MFKEFVDKVVSPFGYFLQTNYMQGIGIANSRKISHVYNSYRYNERIEYHRKQYLENFEELLSKNGEIPEDYDLPKITDGFAFDRSHKLPFLDDLIQDANSIIKRQEGKGHTSIQQTYLRALMVPNDVVEYDSVLNFLSSSPVLKTVADYFQTIPVLSKTKPPGFRLMESNDKYADKNAPYNESQLFHLDMHCDPLMYILVCVRKVDLNSGPWSFLLESSSVEAVKKLNYGRWRVPYRITDKKMYKYVDPHELIVFTGEPGDVLFIDSNKCFHYGSRDAINPRYLVMCAITTPCRTDPSQLFTQAKYPLKESDSQLRRMFLEAHR